MSKITELSIQVKNKNRCNLYLDGEFFRGVSLEIVYKFHLKVGMEIEPNKLNEIISHAEFDEAVIKAINYLSKYVKTKKQVKTYLLSKGYPEETVYKVIDKLKEYNYINDKDYSVKYIESTAKSQGQKLLAYKLMNKGVKKSDIENALDETQIDFKQNALILAKKHAKNKEITIKQLQKTYRYLINKGFSYEDANYAISIIKQET